MQVSQQCRQPGQGPDCKAATEQRCRLAGQTRRPCPGPGKRRRSKQFKYAPGIRLGISEGCESNRSALHRNKVSRIANGEFFLVYKQLDLITIGRASVDLYGRQVGGLLEDMASFSKYIGGSPTNIAAGAARLGLRSALITRVGDEHFGRFIRNQLAYEGVDVRGVITDADRLTALAILGIRDDDSFPLIFYRENCADMALCEADIDEALVSSTRCLCATGTHLSHPRTEAAVLKAVHLARQAEASTALDIDYRPNLWGLAGHGEGESRYISSQRVTDRLQVHLGLFDLIVGTEEEFQIAGGSTDILTALANIRELTSATLVCKRGPLGAVAFADAIPASIEAGETGQGFEVEVYNVLGAGDGFMAGLLKGWLDGKSWKSTMRIANACGALAVSRHGCAPSYPSWKELEFFLSRGVKCPALRLDTQLEQIHWATNRNVHWPQLRVLSLEDCRWLTAMCRQYGHDISRAGDFLQLCVEAVQIVAAEQPGVGVLCNDTLGRKSLYRAAGSGLWIGRPVEQRGTRPVEFRETLGADLGELQEWPLEHVVRVRCLCSSDDSDALWNTQLARLKLLSAAARRSRLEQFLELVGVAGGTWNETSCARAMDRIYTAGIYPDWWGLGPFNTASRGDRLGEIINRRDPNCRGMLLLAMNSNPDEFAQDVGTLATCAIVRGVVVGHDIFGSMAKKWLEGTYDRQATVNRLVSDIFEYCQRWDDLLSN